MAPKKPFRTYSRGNNSRSCVEAFDILFAKNLTQRKLDRKVHKGKSKFKFEIKELPTKIKTVLNDESSLRVNINDTFDELFMHPGKNERSKNVSVKMIADKSSFSVIKHLSSFKNVSPMLYNLRSGTINDTDKNTLDSWFNQPTPPGEGITNSLEIEKVNPNCRKRNGSKRSSRLESSRSSPILLRSRSQISAQLPNVSANKSEKTKDSFVLKDLSKETKIRESIKCTTFSNQNVVLDPIFTNSVTEHILIHSSTPVATNRKKRLVRQALSPIDNRDEVKNCILESLEEIRSWNSSLPQFESPECKNSDNKSQDSQIEEVQKMSFDLEDFELFFEQLKGKSLKTDKLESSDSHFNVKSITLDDFEKFHKRFINSQNNQDKLRNDVSLKEFESFCESHHNKMSFNDSFFDNCHNSINFVTHRKHKFLSPNLHQHSRLSKQFNLKDLVVVLDNNTMNFSSKKQDKSGYSLINSINKKQLTVKLTRFSLDNLKLMFNQNQSYNKDKGQRSVNTFKACRKFSANWNSKKSSWLLPNKSMNIFSHSLSGRADLSNMEVIATRSISRRSTNKSDLSKRYSNIKETIQLEIEEENDKSEKENEVSINDSKKSEKSRKSFVIKSSPVSHLSNCFSGRRAQSDVHYLQTSRLENIKRLSSQEDVIDRYEVKQTFVHSDLSETAGTPKQLVEKQYTAKILLASASDTCTEVHCQKSPVINECSMNSSCSLLPTNNRLVSRTSCHFYPTQDDQQNTSSLNHQKGICFTRIRRSDTNISYVAQDLSKSILMNLNTPSTTSKSSSLELSSVLKSPKNLNDRQTVSPNAMCLRSNVSRKSSLNNENHEKSETKNDSLSCIQRLECSIQDDTKGIDQIEEPMFKIPMTVNFRKKPPNLMTGKSWRRSLLQHKRESFTYLTDNSYCGDISAQLKPTESSGLSTKILPSGESSRFRRKTLLQTYVQSELDINEGTSDVISCTPKKLSFNSPGSLVRAQDLVFQYCQQTELVLFEDIYPKSLLKNCKKIGEGVYGEVFLYSQANGDMTVMKVIPIEGDKLVNGERQKKFHEILSEVVIVSQLSNLRNNFYNKTSAFCNVQRIRCVKGKYPKVLTNLWHEYDKAKGSENDPPDVFENDQLYIVLDLENGGQDLEAFIFNNALQAIAMFKQVAYALAIGEEHLQFEHRDLHWGNILLRAVEKNKKIVFKHKGKVKECLSQGVEITIIDFTLSRIAHDGVVIFNDLGQDPDLFVAKGDYQFDIYRLMKEKNHNDWQKFTAYSNILWLHYILRKSITALRYKNTKTKLHKKSIDLLKKYEEDILSFNCVSEFVDECL